MKRIITIILMCLPFVAFGQTTDYVDRLNKTDEYVIMAGSIYYKEPLEFNTLAEAFSFIGRANRTENARIIEDKELGIVSYKTLDVVRMVRVYGMTFKASYNYNGIIELTYRPEREDYFGSKEYSSVEEAREAWKAETSAIVEAAREARGARGAYKAEISAIVEEARGAYKAEISVIVEEARGAYKAETSANAAKEYLRYMQPTEEELRAILKAVKEDCAPNSEIKKTTIVGEFIRTIFSVDTYQIGNYKIEVAKSDGIKDITIYTR